MSIGNILEIGRSGILANQDALQTTSNNVSNVNTPNYSRQRPQLEARAAVLNFGYRPSGGGVDVARTLRIHDEFVERQIVNESKNFGDMRMRAESLRRMEGVVHQGMVDLSERINGFFNHFRELSLNPEIPALRVAVKESAETLASGFNKLSSTMENIRVELDLRLDSTLENVNRLAEDLARLNASISSVPGNQEPPHELMDQRDAVVRELSSKLGVQALEGERGQVTVLVEGVGVLVQGGEANRLEALRTPGSDPKDPGAMDIFLKTHTGLQYATKAFPGGELGGLIHVRDNVTSRALRQLDNIAFGFTSAVNEAHSQGTGPDDAGLDFFQSLESSDGAAQRFSVTGVIKDDPAAIAVGMEREKSGDNRVALGISELQRAEIIPVGIEGLHGQTVNQALNSIVSEIASETNGAEQMYGHQGAIMEQLDNYRKSVSGVSLEEEAIHLMQFQAAFNAAAKTMQVGDELLETILSLKS